MKKLFLALSIAILANCGTPPDQLADSCDAKCTGSKYCNACKNCNYCKHCNSGGVCGVCSPESFKEKTPPHSKPKTWPADKESAGKKQPATKEIQTKSSK